MNKLLLVGVSHKTAPVEWRERLAVPEERLPALLKEMMSGEVLSEAVVLSTCNRVEAYAVVNDVQEAESAVRRVLTTLHGDPAMETCFYRMEDHEAVRHLFRVAAGLDSLVVGEPEILGQVKRAYESSRSAQATGKLTNVLFQRALFIGKSVRTCTGISDGPISTANLAVTLAQRIFKNLKESRVLIVGAGKMAELSARSFLSQKVARLAVVNRTLEKAQELARRFQGHASPFEELSAELAAADIVLCSTGSPEPVLRRDDVAEAMRHRRGRSLFLIDIAVPRDVDPAVHHLENVYLYNIDDLQSLVAESLVRRHGEIDRASLLVEEKAREFSPWYRAWQQGDLTSLRHSSLAPVSPSLRPE
jgi:glutamyl-tRNA reductase